MKKERLTKRHLAFEPLEARLTLSAAVATTSGNWTGYAATTGLKSVSSVVGTWKVPAVTAPITTAPTKTPRMATVTTTASTAACSVWVGIDGYNSTTVEQIGTSSDIVNGKPVYYAWYEMYPQMPVTITSMTVRPGDTITASVSYVTSGKHAGQFLLSITDTSRKNDSFSIYQTLATAKRSSAEWIVESPGAPYGILMSKFASPVTFSNCTATINGATGAIDNAAWQTYSINLTTNTKILEASTSTLTKVSNSSAFTVSYMSPGFTIATSSKNSSGKSTGSTGLGWVGWARGGWGTTGWALKRGVNDAIQSEEQLACPIGAKLLTDLATQAKTSVEAADEVFEMLLPDDLCSVNLS